MIKHMNPKQRSAGFTLIDAMIAVVILATGILALTVLQTRMMRATAESRDRSEATTTAQNLMEKLRADASQTSTGYGNLASQGLTTGACNLTNSNALKLANLVGETSANDYYRYCVKVTRFWACPSGAFTSDPAVCAAPTAVGFTSEYKQVELTLGWRDSEASGSAASDWHRLTLGDAISGIPLVNSKELQNRSLNGGNQLGGAQVRYPGSFFADESNFIPIAVGNNGSGARIAATNPTPEVTGGGVAETSFQIYTYLSQTGAIQVQRQVDTKAVACTCTLQNAPSTATTMADYSLRPSYWDGRRYTQPKNVKNQSSYLRGTHTGGSTESEYCDVCCRDHQDPAGYDYNGDDDSDPADDNPKFDVFTLHEHWNNGTKALSVGDTYKEVCRVVRVDGIYRVTPDPAMEHFAYLPTDSDAAAPTTERMSESPSFRYNTFVRNFVKERLNLAAALAAYTQTGFLSTSSIAAMEDATEVNLNQYSKNSGKIQISSNDTNSVLGDPARYLHDRVIVMDPLEYQARQVIKDGIASSSSCTSDPLPCVLPSVPFASVNLTPLTRWNTDWVKQGAALTPARTLSQAAFSISPQDVLSTNQSRVDVYAGQVGINTSKATGAPDVDSLIATISRSVTALVERFVLFPTTTQAQTDLWRLTDAQTFQVTNDPPQGIRFSLKPSGLTYMTGSFNNNDAPDVRWVRDDGTTGGGVCFFDSAEKDYNCFIPQSALVGTLSPKLKMVIVNYHQRESIKQNENVSCPSPDGKGNVKTQYPAKCSIWRATTASIGMASMTVTQSAIPSTLDNPADDQIDIAVPQGGLADGAVLAVAFNNPKTGLLPDRTSPTCNAATGLAQNWAFTACRMD